MHYANCSTPGKKDDCCDCTHFCYTPLFWDNFFDGMHGVMLRQIQGLRTGAIQRGQL